MKQVRREFLILLMTLVGLTVCGWRTDALAQEEAPAAGAAETGAEEAGEGEAAAPAPAPQVRKTDKWNDAHSIPRNDRFSISWPKLLVLWFLFLVWVRSGDWINRDSQLFDLGYGKWNAIQFIPFFVLLLALAFPLFFPFPHSFVVALGVLLVVYLGTFIPYAVIRNKAVEPHQRVFTKDWFRYQLSIVLGKVGIKMEVERKAEYEKGAPVDLIAMGAKEERDNQANLITARQSPGYLLVKELVADMANKRSDRVILDFSQQSVSERQFIDGVWQAGEPRERESGDVMLAVLKTLANLDMTERRKKQSGEFSAKYNGGSYRLPVVSQGVKTGERVVIDMLGRQQAELQTFADLGMRGKMAEQWGELLAGDQGLLVIASMPEGGVTTLTDVSLMETDRLMRDFISIEDEHKPEREIENVEVTTYDSRAGALPSTDLAKVIRKYPNVMVLRDFSDTEAAKLLLNEVRDERLVITNVRAKEATESLLRMLQLKVPHRDFAALVTAGVCTRLIRKLCSECKVGYEPPPELLKKLGIPASKVDMLYRVPKAEELDKPCPKCAGVGYVGRTGIFELLVVNDKIREILVKQPKLDLLRKAARLAKMRSFQEEGVLLVAKGITSIQELQRVLKQ